MDWMAAKIKGLQERVAFINTDESVTYGALYDRIVSWKQQLFVSGVKPGEVVALIADYSPDSAAMLIALLSIGAIVVPLTAETRAKHDRFFELAGVKHIFECRSGQRDWQHRIRPNFAVPPLAQRLLDEGDRGFVLFTSGTSGESKGVVLSAVRLMRRFENLDTSVDKSLRCMVFLKLDHIGGLNTLFSVLFSGGTAVSVADRSAEVVCEGIEKHQVQLLPTTPTFLNMMLLSGAHLQYDLSSLRIITYGTEPMPASTLRAVHQVFPRVNLKQTYGLTELGIFSTKSKSSDSDWMKIGGEGVEYKIEGNILFIKSSSAMLGYLNAPSPFTEDGWYNTGDRVEVDGEFLRILGRESEIINVGGEKVYPAEVESVLLEMDNVREVLVRGKKSPVTGNIVSATFVLNAEESRSELYQRMNQHCKDKLEPFKIPKMVNISSTTFVGDRLKKARNSYTA